MTNKQHRVLNTILILIIIGGFTMYQIEHQHDIEECEARLFEKLTNMKAPTAEELK